MGRSTPSCFKIISCAGSNEASVDRDHIDVSSENKSPDKRGWSFRKRSGRHRVLSNTVVTEKITSSDNKPISEPISISSEPQINSNISEKTCDSIWTEETPNSVTKKATVSTVGHTKSACEEDDIKCESVPDRSESAVLVIQAAVRRFLAERQLVKHKNVVKLQAAVRGHLVRNHAVGTLRCIRAIVKMQALVRARRQKGVQNAGIDSGPKYISVEKLLSNRLASQLLESTPKTKQINIKCDPLKSDSTWNWLERWMSVSSPDVLESHAPEHDQYKVVINSKNDVEELLVPSEDKENLIHIEESFIVKAHEDEKPVTESIEKPDSLADEPMDLNTEPQIEVNSIPENPVSETELKPIPENPVSESKPEPELIPENPVSETKPKPIPENPVSETKPEPIPENPVSEPKPKPIPENLVSEMEPKRAAKRVATDQPDSEGRKSVFGSRKASNPAFIAAQSRFEELTSMTKPNIEIVMPEKQVDQKLNDTEIELEPEQEPESSQPEHEHKSNEHELAPQISASGSPRSHITIPESQGTPSSQVSTNTKKSKSDKKSTSQKRKSWSTSKKSSVDSGPRTSLEQLPKDTKPGKRRNSFGSPKPDHVDHEVSVPSYMQATESARAKAIANSSPALSPDVHDKEAYLKKRHSLPGAVNTRQGSPRIQRSMSQALQATKGNGNQERKWQR
ncbi:putative IQ motif, EF-hand binding protein [Helianthus debilis subsp. tardiflorus]